MTIRKPNSQFCKQNFPPQTTPSHHTSCITYDRRLPAAYTDFMMSIHKLSAGDGYLYYMKEVTSGDDVRQRGQSMSDYYLETGNPEGRWMGSGAHHLALDGHVKERQMELLFGLGLDPRYDERLKENVAAAMANDGDIDKAMDKARIDSKLGRAYYKYNLDEDPFVLSIQEAIDAKKTELDRDLEPDELRAARLERAAKHFTDEKQRPPADAEELTKYLHAKLRGPSSAVAGYDLTFSPQKSVSTLWALTDSDMSKYIEQAHLDAIDHAVAWIEEEAIRTRAGVNGVAQIDVKDGIVAARFRHYESRTGDPQLHDHVVVANKVMGADGRWRSIDGSLLYKSSVAASEVYNSRLAELLHDRLGVQFESREREGKRPVLEVKGISDDLMRDFSSRRESITPVLNGLVDEYTRQHGRAPSKKQMMQLAQQATLDTRPEKQGGKTLGELREGWTDRAKQFMTSQDMNDLVQDVTTIDPERETPSIDVDELGMSVVETVSENRGVWSTRHLHAEAQRQLSHLTHGAGVDGDVLDQVVAAAREDWSVRIGGGHDMPISRDPSIAKQLHREDEVDVYTRHREETFTSAELLLAESELLDLAQTDAVPAVSGETFDTVLERYRAKVKGKGRDISDSQAGLSREFATGSSIITAGVGPAGAGKTTSMKLFAEAIQEQGGNLIALAPSRQAASVLGAELESHATTIDSWLLSKKSTLSTGDVILIDEAGMAGTRKIREVARRAQDAGAHVRLIGDYRQLSAIESGGALRLIHKIAGGPELEDVFRFNDHDEREASLILRDGDETKGNVFQWYINEKRAVAADSDNAVAEAYTAWQTDTLDGKNSIMLAGDMDSVTELNSRAQAFRIGEGEVTTDTSVRSRDGHDIGLGDIIVTRRNDPNILIDESSSAAKFVINGARWTVTDIGDDGSIEATPLEADGSATLTADYVAKNVQLGYALTVHRAQGVTVDSCHAVLSPELSRNSAYVAMTRGRENNMAYVITDDGDSVDVPLDQIGHNVEGSGSAHEAIRDAMIAEVDPVKASHIYQDLAWKADLERMKDHVDDAAELRGLKGEVFYGGDSTGWPVVVAKLVEGEQQGWTPAHILDAALWGDIAEANDPASLLAFRLGKLEDNAPEILADDSRQFKNIDDETLQSEHKTALNRKRDASRLLDARLSHTPAPVTLKDSDTEIPAWSNRQFGDLTHHELKHRQFHLNNDHQAELILGYPETAEKIAGDLEAVETELANRKNMGWKDHAREDWQRDRATDPDSSYHSPTASKLTIDEATEAYKGAKDLADAIRSEIRNRATTPDLPPKPDLGPDGMPEWFAPRGALADEKTPTPWANQLANARAVLDDKVNTYKERLYADRPGWAGPLRPADRVPVALWRSERGIADSITDPMPVENPDTLPATQRALYERAHKTGAPTLSDEQRAKLAAIRQQADPRTKPEPSELLDRVREIRRDVTAHQNLHDDDDDDTTPRVDTTIDEPTVTPDDPGTSRGL